MLAGTSTGRSLGRWPMLGALGLSRMRTRTPETSNPPSTSATRKASLQDAKSAPSTRFLDRRFQSISTWPMMIYSSQWSVRTLTAATLFRVTILRIILSSRASRIPSSQLPPKIEFLIFNYLATEILIKITNSTKETSWISTSSPQ